MYSIVLNFFSVFNVFTSFSMLSIYFGVFNSLSVSLFSLKRCAPSVSCLFTLKFICSSLHVRITNNKWWLYFQYYYCNQKNQDANSCVLFIFFLCIAITLKCFWKLKNERRSMFGKYITHWVCLMLTKMKKIWWILCIA